jgi:predicted esterase
MKTAACWPGALLTVLQWTAGCGGSRGATSQGAGTSTASTAASGGARNAGGSSGTGGSSSTSGATGGATPNACPPPAGDSGPSTSATRQTPKPLGGSSTAPNGYFEYLPIGYDGSCKAPLLVFWHGIGQDGNGGSDLPNVLALGPPELIHGNQWPDALPFVVLSPQYTAVSGQITPGGGCPSSAIVHAFLTWAVASYSIDPKRIYLTGLSCGAIGTWDYLGDHRGELVAAAVPLSGNPGDPTQAGSAWKRAGCGLGGAAIWSFHGDADTVVPYAPDHDTMQDLIACPMPPRRSAKFTDVAGGGHNIWDPVYLTMQGDIYAWMLANAKP